MDPRNKEHIDAEVEKKHSDRKSAFEIDFFFSSTTLQFKRTHSWGSLSLAYHAKCRAQRWHARPHNSCQLTYPMRVNKYETYKKR